MIIIMQTASTVVASMLSRKPRRILSSFQAPMFWLEYVDSAMVMELKG